MIVNGNSTMRSPGCTSGLGAFGSKDGTTARFAVAVRLACGARKTSFSFFNPAPTSHCANCALEDVLGYLRDAPNGADYRSGGDIGWASSETRQRLSATENNHFAAINGRSSTNTAEGGCAPQSFPIQKHTQGVAVPHKPGETANLLIRKAG
jgi:hypothetical protein